MIFLTIVLGAFVLNYLILYWILIINDISMTKDENSKMQDFFVSVVIPFRNEEKSIQNLLKSLFEQSFSKDMFEIILVNDHSTDASKPLIFDFIKSSEILITLIELEDDVVGRNLL